MSSNVPKDMQQYLCVLETCSQCSSGIHILHQMHLTFQFRLAVKNLAK